MNPAFVAGLPRNELMLQGLDLARLRGAEVGPLDRPLVRKNQGRVFYVDHCDTAALKARWSTDPGVDVARLHVDAVWGTLTLRQALDSAGAYDDAPGLDYLVASHVIEHVPDLVTWLREVGDALAAEGRLRLAVPDKRYTFDLLRRTSALSEVLDAHVRQRRVPAGSRILDFALHMVPVDAGAVWRNEVRPDQLVHGYTPADAIALARDAEQNGTYHDVHCWVFTPASFVELMVELCRCGLLDFGCEWIVPTAPGDMEFFVAMRREGDAAKARESWQRAAASLASIDGTPTNDPSRSTPATDPIVRTVAPAGWAWRRLMHRMRVMLAGR